MKKATQILQAIRAQIAADPGSNPTHIIQEQFHVSRETVRLYLRQLLASGELRSEGYGKGTKYFPVDGPADRQQDILVQLTDRIKCAELAAVGEDEIYNQIIKSRLAGKINAGLNARVHYVITELLNNVIDHAQANHTTISVTLDSDFLTVAIADDGVGVFKTIQDAFKLEHPVEAIGELAKGKRTRDPAHHAGEGIFFSSRMANRLTVQANNLSYTYDSVRDDWTIEKSSVGLGSIVTALFDSQDQRTPADTFNRYTENFQFKFKSARLVNPYTITLPEGDFPSRSEAKKILQGAADFKSLVIDFKHVSAIGQGFADEIFRVFQRQHPDTTIEVKHANELILRMITHVTGTDKK